MPRLSNQARRYPHRHLPPGPHEKPLMPDNEFQALQEAKKNPPKENKGQFDEKQIARAKTYLKHVRRCQEKQQRPRSVPKRVLETMIILKMV